jgi:hypothetical protein
VENVMEPSPKSNLFWSAVSFGVNPGNC